jgi:hypothetical protein
MTNVELRARDRRRGIGALVRSHAGRTTAPVTRQRGLVPSRRIGVGEFDIRLRAAAGEKDQLACMARLPPIDVSPEDGVVDTADRTPG